MTTDSAIRGAVVAVQRGRVAPLGPKSVPSGFVKTSADGPVAVGTLGLAGDEQADLSVHGGPDKAVYAYPVEHYSVWRAAFPRHERLLVPGGLGENLTLEGFAETGVCIGDVYEVGDGLVVQVTQPRQPCFKFGLRFDDPAMPRAMTRNGLCGWYFRVPEPGEVAAGAAVVLKERPNPAWTVARFNALVTTGRAAMTPSDLRELAALPGLAATWRERAVAALRRES